MELRRYFEVAWAYRWHLVVVPLVAALVALAATFVVSPRYVGVATVQIIPEEIEPRTVTLRTQEGAGGPIAIGLKDPTELLSQGIIEVLRTREVAEIVIARLDLDRSVEPQGFAAFKAWALAQASDAWAFARYGYVARGDPHDAAVQRTQSALTGQLVRGSYHMKISASWPEPKVAAAMANAAVDAVVEHSRRIAAASAGDRKRFLEGQVREARRRADDAREAMLQYSARTDALLGESVKSQLLDLETARQKVRETDVALADARASLAEAERQLAETPRTVVNVQDTQGRSESDGSTTASRSTSSTTTSVSALNPAYVVLTDRINALRQEIAALLSISGEVQFRALSDARANLAEAERQLAATPRTIVTVQETQSRAGGDGGPGASKSATSTTTSLSSPSAIHVALSERVNALRQETAALQSSRSERESQLRAREERFRGLVLHDSRLAALNQDVLLANQIYSRLSLELQNAAVEELRPVTQIRLTDGAIAPAYPAQPVKIVWVGLAAAAGLAAAVVLVFVLYSTDRSLRSREETEAALPGLRLLAVVPGKAALKARAPVEIPSRRIS